jgi:hypothetical protein
VAVRQEDPSPPGGAPPVGNTVDVATGSYTSTIGGAQLATAWTNPAFDPAQAG